MKMTAGTIRGILSIIVVGAFVGTSALIALTPAVGGYPPEKYTQHLQTFASLYSGITGLVLGYYFGRRDSPEHPISGKATPE
jgi:hypothetical protein